MFFREEPISLAIALLEKHLPTSHFDIEGYDISKKLLSKAEIGSYGTNSFRGRDLSFREKYFNQVGSEYQVNKSVKRLIKFSYANLFDATFYLQKRQLYDVIFCRNLFIYLNRTARKRAFDIFKRLLIPEIGVLVVSPAETKLARSMGFELLHNLRDCAFLNKRIEIKLPKKPIEEPYIEEKPPEKPKKEIDVELLKKALSFADSGEFEEAANLCLEFIKKYGPDPEAYFLLGLIQHAKGHEEEAEELFKKAIYLNPKHYEALVYLNLLAVKRGDEKQAELYRQRIENLK